MVNTLRIPVSTYRIQMHRGFGFQDALRILPYLDQLGITDSYTSPVLKARAGSTHGYDITDHHQLNPELGTASDFEQFHAALQERHMGHLLDFVPNHMGIDPSENPWWHDVLENGPSSSYARYFDINWNPLKPELKNKVLLPILGDQYGAVLERGELQLIFEDGALGLRYGDQKLPISPRRTPDVLKTNLALLQAHIDGTPDYREFLSILTALSNLPSSTEKDPARIEERQREKEVARERLLRLYESSAPIREHIQACLLEVNGHPGKPESFDALHQLLEEQSYRLAYWKTAFHEINYRRFFDINQLSGLRMERPDVFNATHQRLFEWIHQGLITGLRLDHPDGLYNPAAYFEALQVFAGPLYVVAEKILSAGETLRKSWAIQGTSGYDFLNLVNHLWIDSRHRQDMKTIYELFIAKPADSQEEVYECKKLIMATALASELNVLAHQLNQISETNRLWRDFTLDSLKDALQEVVACFPVYRTYISGATPSPSDELIITRAVGRAKSLNPAMESSIFDFIRAMLSPQRTPGLAPEEYERRLQFAMKFQQYTAPVQAKSVEDTAFYRYNLLLSLNEVGGDLERFGISVTDFHQANVDRQRDWPGAMLATATHDTKRGEDARTRLDVLSELPEEWEHAVFQWAAMNRPCKTLLDGRLCPDANDEYLLYQALLGAWPPDTLIQDLSSLLSRMRDYAIKATREAKRHTSWIRPNEDYEKATLDFLDRILAPKESTSGFLPAFAGFVKRISTDGMLNSLAQVTLKMAVPGVPDFYQGTDLWDWSLVDPDNRKAVDFETRERFLKELEPLDPINHEANHSARETVSAVATRPNLAPLRQLLRHWEDGRVKLWLTALGLRFRKAHPDLFLHGSYIPLKVTGEMAEHVVAFARDQASDKLVVIVPRLIARYKLKTRLWESTRVQLPDDWSAEICEHLFTGETFHATTHGSLHELSLADVFATLPVAWIKVTG